MKIILRKSSIRPIASIVTKSSECRLSYFYIFQQKSSLFKVEKYFSSHFLNEYLYNAYYLYIMMFYHDCGHKTILI